MSLIDTLERAAGARHVVPKHVRRRQLELQRLLQCLPRQPPSISTTLLLAQQARCFHCSGYMPVDKAFTDRPSAVSREHVVAQPARSARPGNPDHTAILLAHKLCNAERGTRPLNAIEWDRAIALWRRADSLWLAAGCTASPFPSWLDLAYDKLKELRS